MDILQTVATGEFSKDKFVEYVVRLEDLDPQVLSTELEIVPSRAFAKGEYLRTYRDPRTGKDGKELYVHPWGLWVIDSKAIAVTEKLENHILYLLEKLEPKRDYIERYLRPVSKCTVSFYIWWRPNDGEGSYLISSQSLQRMSKLCHHTEFAFFA